MDIQTLILPVLLGVLALFGVAIIAANIQSQRRARSLSPEQRQEAEAENRLQMQIW